MQEIKVSPEEEHEVRSPEVDIIIIGAGPAGISCALQLKRFGYDPLVIERDSTGGLVRNAYLVENLPGFQEGIRGPDLVHKLEGQLRRWGIHVIHEEVIEVDLSVDSRFLVTSRPVKMEERKKGVDFEMTEADAHMFELDQEISSQVGDGGEFLDQGLSSSMEMPIGEPVEEDSSSSIERSASILVIASGTRPKKFTCPGLEEIPPEKIKTEIHDLVGPWNYAIAIVGAGDAAFDYALSLSEGNHVVILNRGSEPKCLPLLKQRVLNRPNIRYYSMVDVTNLSWAGTKMVLTTAGAGPGAIPVDYLVPAIGREPNDAFLSERVLSMASLLRQEGKYYTIGDVQNGQFRQTAIASGDGIRTAMEINQRIEG